jgi:hypothetical protein
MQSVSASQIRNQLDSVIAAAQREPVEIIIGTERRAVVMSPEFYDRAVRALEGPFPDASDRAFLELADKVMAKAQAVGKDPKRRRPRLR